jgi:hypothetical protein
MDANISTPFVLKQCILNFNSCGSTDWWTTLLTREWVYREMNSWSEPRSRKGGHFILSSSIATCTLLLRCKGHWIYLSMPMWSCRLRTRMLCVSRTGPRDWAGPDRLDSAGSPRWSESTPSWAVGLEWSEVAWRNQLLPAECRQPERKKTALTFRCFRHRRASTWS